MKAKEELIHANSDYGCAGAEGKDHDRGMTVLADDAEAEPLIQVECRVGERDAERDRGVHAISRGKERAK